MKEAKMIKTQVKNGRRLPAIVGAALLLASTGALADTLGDSMCNLLDLFVGKYLFGISVLALFASGSALLFGAELTDGVKRAVTIVAIISLIVAFPNILMVAFAGTKFVQNICT